STVLRNILINWLVLIPALAAILAVPECVRTIVACGGPDWLRRGLVVAGLILALFAAVYVFYDLPSGRNAKMKQELFLSCCLLPLTISSILVCIYLGWSWNLKRDFSWWYPVALITAI